MDEEYFYEDDNNYYDPELTQIQKDLMEQQIKESCAKTKFYNYMSILAIFKIILIIITVLIALLSICGPIGIISLFSKN